MNVLCWRSLKGVWSSGVEKRGMRKFWRGFSLSSWFGSFVECCGVDCVVVWSGEGWCFGALSIVRGVGVWWYFGIWGMANDGVDWCVVRVLVCESCVPDLSVCRGVVGVLSANRSDLGVIRCMDGLKAGAVDVQGFFPHGW